MFNIIPSQAFRSISPNFIGAQIEANVTNSETSPALWKEIGGFIKDLRTRYTTETLKQHPGIAATRAAYRTAGKDPSRYRPACEQLVRRVLQGKELYKVNTLVDLVNFASLFSGYSTAALDADSISGTEITLDLGRAGEPYEGIGRGILNVECLPIYRDEIGGFATPTSDSTRTMMSLSTRHILILINGYDGDHENLERTAHFTQDLLKRHADCPSSTLNYY